MALFFIMNSFMKFETTDNPLSLIDTLAVVFLFFLGAQMIIVFPSLPPWSCIPGDEKLLSDLYYNKTTFF